ncbi:MAG TPA: hypothetical protein VGK14_11650 [Novimethylophilus sp.]|jgi:hypothetical protein|uniref:hypothetical protein n=1 Tax=Novimethylophilus sp. TaxID=2137426 RepID=UPI002F3E5FD6
MKKNADAIDDESQNPLWKTKRERQALSRALVRSGERTQESMFLISSEIVKTLKIRHRA